MQVPAADLALVGWATALWAAADGLRVLARRESRAAFLPLPAQQHAWLAGIVALGVLWSLQIRLAGGYHLSMLGMPLYALMLGRGRAALGGLVALAGLVALGARSWDEAGLHALTGVALPALVADFGARVVARLPRNVFVFIIGNGLFVNLAGIALGNAAGLGLQLLLAPDSVQDAAEVLGYVLLLAWGEALVAGMAFSALVIYAPRLVMTYAQDEYLPRR